ncbi:MAG: hypothetical protein KJO55_10615, partial [Gammaproteobacteria bacterium]|nr:hypothetical protein [Gammaproteobacteria bacterium]
MFIKSIRFIAMLSLALGASSAFADNLPSPCGVGEIGSGTNCMYLVVAGNSYDPATGDRELSSAP